MDLTPNHGASNLEIAKVAIPRVSLTFHRYLPVAAFYFFFNAAGLPTGLFYTSVFAPVLLVWLYLKGHRRLTLKFLLVASPFLLAHLFNGVASPAYYLRSLLLLWTVYIAVFAFCSALKESQTVNRLFEQLILLNFTAAVLAVLALATPLRSAFWTDDPDTIGSGVHLLRLRLFSTEPSAYSLLMLPLLLFASLRLFRKGSIRNCTYLFMIVFPFLLCQSFGGISMYVAALGISLMASYRRMFKHANSFIILACSMLVIAALLGTHNPISERVLQVISGGDSSSKSRTIFSFVAAYAVASSKSIIWGAGLGQGKLIDFSAMGIGFDVNVIPNAVAGTFAELGLVGAIFRIAIELYLFVKTKPYRDSFRIAMFVVAFITQLTGSYLTDVQEYLLWFFAFYPLFPEFSLLDNGLSGTVMAPDRVSPPGHADTRLTLNTR